MNNQRELTVIGGFGFNYQPLKSLDQLNLAINFIDINQFAANYSLEQMAHSLVQQINPTQPIDILAYSSGGLLALKVYHDYPHLINRLILLNSTPRFMMDSNWLGINQTNFNKILHKTTILSPNSLMPYLSTLYAHPYSIAENIQMHWSNSNTPQLTNWLSIIHDSDLRGNYLFTDKLLWLNSKHDSIIKLNLNYLNTTIIDDSSHLMINHQQLLIHVNAFLDR